ncbi:hypothetical protein [Halostagnicola kamekurae]|uniref:Domain of unknown function domain-containing protein n=1 Tax=Halostagnicola kamekurae TaxID=619731 RepID=A0A1I6QPU7_9EURY|nr:hypothetical protein [Halostagnicola kamekurae]SFS54382.1 hypothetical protein SAMN04488556_1428 [Halostagnicola kamekurae]
MPTSGASLLTEKQRERVQRGFDGYDDDAKRSRDRQQIRDRIARGVIDFQRLQEAGYSDKELKLVFGEVRADDNLAQGLIDMAVFHRRAVYRSHLDYDAVMKQADAKTSIADQPHQERSPLGYDHSPHLSSGSPGSRLEGNGPDNHEENNSQQDIEDQSGSQSAGADDQPPHAVGEPITRLQFLSTMIGLGYLVLATTLTIPLPAIILGGFVVFTFVLFSFVWPAGGWFQKVAGSAPTTATDHEESG